MQSGRLENLCRQMWCRWRNHTLTGRDSSVWHLQASDHFPDYSFLSAAIWLEINLAKQPNNSSLTETGLMYTDGTTCFPIAESHQIKLQIKKGICNITSTAVGEVWSLWTSSIWDPIRKAHPCTPSLNQMLNPTIKNQIIHNYKICS